MTGILKKYLVQNWWIPLLLFITSIFLFFNNTILPNTDFSFFLLITSAVILLISGIWQLFQGRKSTGFLQLVVLIIPVLFLGLIAHLFGGMLSPSDGELSKGRIEPLIKEKTDLIIPKNYEIVENLIEHTEGAFDSDYSIGLTIIYQESEEKYITEQILKNMGSKSDKGIWKYYKNGFEFKHSENDNNRAEPYYFKVDTLSNTIELDLMHL